MDETNTIHSRLPLGFKLLWYEIVAVLGQGNFGVTYLAFDSNLQRKVAIKEYMPLEFAVRDYGNNTIHPLTSNQEAIYKWGLDRFMAEARTLARFKHPSIVKVYMVFDENNTAYMVMEYEQGEALSQLFKRRELTSESELLEIIVPLLEGLEIVHTAHVIHRDIKPANIYISENRSPVLIDFGSARQALGNRTRTLTSLVTPGFAPYEQYYESGKHQGPWSDIYALGATAYLAITGEPPTDALVRGRSLLVNAQDDLTPAVVAGAGRYSSHFLAAIDRALMFKEADRPQSTKEFRQMLLGEIAITHTDIEKKEQKEEIPQPSATEETIPIQVNRDQRSQHIKATGAFEKPDTKPKILLIAGSILSVLAIASTGIYTFLNHDILIIESDRQGRLMPEHQEREKTLIAQAYESVGKADWHVAIKKFQEALIINPESLPAKQGIAHLAKRLVKLAEKAIAEKDSRKAKEYLRIALSIIPNMSEAKKLEEKIVALERQRIQISTLEASLKLSRQELKNIKAKADSIEAISNAQQPYRNAQQLYRQAEELTSTALSHKHSANYNEAIAGFKEAITLFNRASTGFENAHSLAREKIAEIPKAKPLTKEDIGHVKSRLMEFKQACEQQDLEKLQQISTMPATRLNILRMIFREYRDLRVSISNFAMISDKHSAAATVTITKLRTQSGDPVIPSEHWKEVKASAPNISFADPRSVLRSKACIAGSRVESC